MHRSDWRELSFLECLEVLPETNEDAGYNLYSVEKDGITLLVKDWLYHSYISVSLYQEDSVSPLIDFSLWVNGKIRYINDMRGEYLELSDCIVVPKDFYLMQDDDPNHPANSEDGVTVEIGIKPHIRVRFCG